MNYYTNDNPLSYISKYLENSSYLRRPYGTPEVNIPTGNLDLFPVDEAFMKGTIFRTLYKPYKNHQPKRIVPTNEKTKLLLDVDKYYFALHEIRMYLDAYPTDQEAINVFSEYQKAYLSAKHAYESKYGALDIEGPHLDKSPWMWTMETWPWDEGM